MLVFRAAEAQVRFEELRAKIKADAEEKARREAEHKSKEAVLEAKRQQAKSLLQDQHQATIKTLDQSGASGTAASGAAPDRRMSFDRPPTVSGRSTGQTAQERERRDQEAKARAEDVRRRAEERVKEAQAKARDRAKAQAKADKFLNRLASST